MSRNRSFKILIVLFLLLILFTGQIVTRPSVTISQADVSQGDTTNDSTINFTAVFSEPITDFATGDVALSGTAGATTAIVTGSGTTYNIAVSGMTNDGTVIVDIPAGVAHDAANNPNNALTFSDAQTVKYDSSGPVVTIDQAPTLQTDPSSTSPINFTVVFNEPTTDFAAEDVLLSGTAGAKTVTVTGSGTTYYLSVSGMTGSGTVIVDIPAGVAHDAIGNANSTAVFIDNSVTYDITPPTVVNNNLVTSYSIGPNYFTITFSEDVNDSTGNTNAGDVTNPDNLLLVEAGENKIIDTTTCSPLQSPGSGRQGDDIQIAVNSVSYDASTFTTTININNNTPLPDGNYRLFVCGTALILDKALNSLAGDGSTTGTDFVYNFAVNPSAENASGIGQGGSGSSQLPLTGFAPDITTLLPAQPIDSTYTSFDSLWLEIPSQNVKTNIVGVPETDNIWDVNWLGTDIGWLNGTAFPSWEGNSVLTGHVTNASGLPGPFANLKNLNIGDQIIVHLFDQQYTFEVRVTRLVRPYTTKYAFKHLEGNSFLTLITCEDYNPFNDTYLFRRIIRAELVSVK